MIQIQHDKIFKAIDTDRAANVMMQYSYLVYLMAFIFVPTNTSILRLAVWFCLWHKVVDTIIAIFEYATEENYTTSAKGAMVRLMAASIYAFVRCTIPDMIVNMLVYTVLIILHMHIPYYFFNWKLAQVQAAEGQQRVVMFLWVFSNFLLGVLYMGYAICAAAFGSKFVDILRTYHPSAA